MPLPRDATNGYGLLTCARTISFGSCSARTVQRWQRHKLSSVEADQEQVVCHLEALSSIGSSFFRHVIQGNPCSCYDVPQISFFCWAQGNSSL